MNLHVVKEKLLYCAAVLFAVVGTAGTFLIVFDLYFSRPLALATILGLVLGAACAAAWFNLRSLRRYCVRVLDDHTTLSFRRGDPAKRAEIGAAAGLIHAVTRFQCLRQSLDSLQIQKFVSEPSEIDPSLLLKEWNYAGRIAVRQVGPCAVQPAPQLSDSRSLLFSYRLPHPVAPGETFTLTEDMSFLCDLSKPGDFYVFQIREPTRRRTVDFLFNGLRPEKAGFRLDDGHRGYTTGRLEIEETGPETYRVSYQWKNPAVDEELRIFFTWPEEMVRAAEAERAAGGLSPATGELLSAALDGEDTASASPVPELPAAAADESETAEDHPVIKAARERIKANYGEDE